MSVQNNLGVIKGASSDSMGCLPQVCKSLDCEIITSNRHVVFGVNYEVAELGLPSKDWGKFSIT